MNIREMEGVRVVANIMMLPILMIIPTQAMATAAMMVAMREAAHKVPMGMKTKGGAMAETRMGMMRWVTVATMMRETVSVVAVVMTRMMD